MELIDELLADAKERMTKSVESSRGELATVRTGRASPHLLDRIAVDYYGNPTPLKQLANVDVGLLDRFLDRPQGALVERGHGQ